MSFQDWRCVCIVIVTTTFIYREENSATGEMLWVCNSFKVFYDDWQNYSIAIDHGMFCCICCGCQCMQPWKGRAANLHTELVDIYQAFSLDTHTHVDLPPRTVSSLHKKDAPSNDCGLLGVFLLFVLQKKNVYAFLRKHRNCPMCVFVVENYWVLIAARCQRMNVNVVMLYAMTSLI